MMRWSKIISLCSMLLIMGIDSQAFARGMPSIDTKDLDKGIVHISYTSPNEKRLKVMVEKESQKYTYNLDASGKVETFPLQLGNGNYKISILENTAESKYRLVESTTVELELDNPNKVYLNSIQNINWSPQMEAIKKAKELSGEAIQSQEKVKSVYGYIIDGYSYDYDKLAKLPTTYLPIIDKTYREKTGICYDFSALYAGMLRSQGVPVKLVKGYSPNAEGYHAWNEAYNEKTGEWMIIDSTYDLQVIRKDKPVNMIKSSKEYQKVNEY